MSKKILCLCAAVLMGSFGFVLSTQAKTPMIHSTLIENPALNQQAATEECVTRITRLMGAPITSGEVEVKKEGTIGWRCMSNVTHLAKESEKK